MLASQGVQGTEQNWTMNKMFLIRILEEQYLITI